MFWKWYRSTCCALPEERYRTPLGFLATQWDTLSIAAPSCIIAQRLFAPLCRACGNTRLSPGMYRSTVGAGVNDLQRLLVG